MQASCGIPRFRFISHIRLPFPRQDAVRDTRGFGFIVGSVRERRKTAAPAERKRLRGEVIRFRLYVEWEDAGGRVWRMVESINRPMESGGSNITELLLAWNCGDAKALELLTPLVYEHLHRLARHYMARERPGHTLQASALVNEAYLRLVDSNRVQWQNRTHFFVLAAQIMRRILVDAARARRSGKGGGGFRRTTLDEGVVVSNQSDPDLVALDDALEALSAMDPRKAKVVELRFFGGLDEKEIAHALRVSVDTVQRDWKAARAWLYAELKG